MKGEEGNDGNAAATDFVSHQHEGSSSPSQVNGQLVANGAATAMVGSHTNSSIHGTSQSSLPQQKSKNVLSESSSLKGAVEATDKEAAGGPAAADTTNNTQDSQ